MATEVAQSFPANFTSIPSVVKYWESSIVVREGVKVKLPSSFTLRSYLFKHFTSNFQDYAWSFKSSFSMGQIVSKKITVHFYKSKS